MQTKKIWNMYMFFLPFSKYFLLDVSTIDTLCWFVWVYNPNETIRRMSCIFVFFYLEFLKTLWKIRIMCFPGQINSQNSWFYYIYKNM